MAAYKNLIFVLTCFYSASLYSHSVAAFQRKGKVIAFFQDVCSTVVPNPCQHVCVDIRSGGFYCQCNQGYTINKDGMTCTESENDVEAAIGGGASTSQSPLPLGGGPPKESQRQGSSSTNSVQFDDDNNAVHIKSIDLKSGLPPIKTDAYRRPMSESGLVLNHDDFYNIPEGGTYDSQDGNDNLLNIPEGGDHGSEGPQTNGGSLPLIHEKLLSHLGAGVSCDEVVCENNGTCTMMESKAVCRCPLGTDGEYCERAIEMKYPKFVGTGFLALPILRDAHKEFRVSLHFRPESPYGLLLFSAELADAKTDFVSVVLEDGFIIYRFDCGTGPAVLKTATRVKMGVWNKLIVTRQDTKGTLQLNSDHEVEGQSRGDYTRITLRLNLYLGGYSNMSAISHRVATSHQFVGCVQELVINRHRFDFRKKGLVGEAEFGVNVGECSEHVCDKVTCLNGGTCTAKSADKHVCLCRLGYHGETCQKDSPVHIPHFSGHSYLQYPGLERTVLSYTEIEIVFKPTSLDGTVFYNGFSRDRQGDFISLVLHDGHLEFRFDLGTGPAIIRSHEPLATNVWHLVRASRTGLMGTLDIDGQIQKTGQAEGAYTQLTLLEGLYLGGHPNYDHTSMHANTSKSFTGCLQKVSINKRVISLMSDAVAGVNIGPCSHPCAGRPCMNGGECKPRYDAYLCSCPIGFGNTNCEDVQEHLPTKPMFTGESYLIYKDREITKRVSGNRMDLQIHLRPKGHDGLIFWSGEDVSSKSQVKTLDYIALGFHAGSLQLSYNLGSGEAVIKYNDSKLFDGEWHFIKVQRDKQNAYMEIDMKEVVEGSSPGVYASLNTNKMVYLGGMPNTAEKTRGRFTVGYSGCIRSLKLATDYDVKLLNQAHMGRNVDQCQNHFPCQKVISELGDSLKSC